MDEQWRRITVTPESNIFPIFQKAIKQVPYEKESLTINVINKVKSAASKKQVKETFKFIFNWIDEDTCGIELFKKIGEE